MTSIQHILEKESEAKDIIAKAEKEASKIKQQAEEKHNDDLEKFSQTLEKEKIEKLNHQKEHLVQKHKEITNKGKIESGRMITKAQQHKNRAIDLILENISK